MIATIPWTAVALGVSTLVFLLFAAWTVLRIRANTIPPSPSELTERRALPITPLNRIAWWGVLIGAAQVTAILALFLTRGGPDAYWNDDGLRMLIVGLFLTVIPTSTIVRALLTNRADERDRPLLNRAVVVQSILVLLTVVAWTTTLPMMFREQGAVPVVYCYLIFGSVFIMHLVSYPFGILLAGWGSRHHAQG